MKLLFLGLIFGFLSHAQTAVVAEGEGIQYQRKATGIAKDVARENARLKAVQRCRKYSEHIQRVSEWTYRRTSPDTIVARATFVCGVAHTTLPNTLGGVAVLSSRAPRRNCYPEGAHLDLRLCDKCCAKNCSYIIGSPIGTCN
jgi:hypothetical protein